MGPGKTRLYQQSQSSSRDNNRKYKGAKGKIRRLIYQEVLEIKSTYQEVLEIKKKVHTREQKEGKVPELPFSS